MSISSKLYALDRFGAHRLHNHFRFVDFRHCYLTPFSLNFPNIFLEQHKKNTITSSFQFSFENTSNKLIGMEFSLVDCLKIVFIHFLDFSSVKGIGQDLIQRGGLTIITISSHDFALKCSARKTFCSPIV